jgi:hypothetical protein
MTLEQHPSIDEEQQQQVVSNIAALDALPGRTLYVRTDDATVLRIGTVEGEDAEAYLLSFPSLDGGKRADPERIAIGRILQPEDIENLEDSARIYVEDRRLVRPTERGFAEVLEIRETLTQQARAVRARRLRYADGHWDADEETRDYPTNELYPALFLAHAYKWRYHQAVDPFFDVIAELIGGNATIESDAAIQIGGVTVPLKTRLIVSDLTAIVEAVAHPTLANMLADLDPKLLVRGTVRSTSAEPHWIAQYAAIGGTGTSWSFDGGHAPGRINISSPLVTITLRDGRPAFTREIFEGVAFRAFTHRILRREPSLPMHPLLQSGPDSIRLNLLGRPALIYIPPRHSNDERPVTAVLYHGAPFKESALHALTSVIGYLSGGRGNHALTETFDIQRNFAWFTLSAQPQPHACHRPSRSTVRRRTRTWSYARSQRLQKPLLKSTNQAIKLKHAPWTQCFIIMRRVSIRNTRRHASCVSPSPLKR